MFYCRLNKCIDDPFIFKFDFLFCWMNIYIYLGGVKINEQNIKGKIFGTYHLLVSTHHCMAQIRAADEPVVHKKILITSCLFCCFRFSYKAINVHVVGLFLNCNELCIIVVPQYLYNALFK